MKTINDLAAFIKRNDRTLRIAFKNGAFNVSMLDLPSQSSKRLDDALENLVEEARRQDNGFASLRAGSSDTAGLVVALCGSVTAAGGVCPRCTRLPSMGRDHHLECTVCPSKWHAVDGTVYVINSGGQSARYKYNSAAGDIQWDIQP